MKIKGFVFGYFVIYFQFLIIQIHEANGLRHFSKGKIIKLRENVRSMFQHAYEGYLQHASGFDELRPLTCDGVNTWGKYSLTLIDSMDTLAVMGNYTEFRRVASLLEDKMNFNKDINVSVFETNIRIVGGLLAAHLMSKRAKVPLEPGWPCNGPLLRMAEDVANRLLPAFDTATGMPYGTVNLRFGVPKGETPITCTAGVGTFLVEFGTLSRLTGNPIYEEVALNAVLALWKRRSPLGLFGNHIDVQTGRWTALDSGIGAGVDSFFEYLVKGSILLNRPQLLEMFHEARVYIDTYLKHDDWYMWAGMNKGLVTLPIFQSLEAFWPGLLSMIGDNGSALRTLAKYNTIWEKYGFLPEFYNIISGETMLNRESYPLRPEFAESLMYMYRATKNPFLLEIGENMIHSIEFSAKTKCGYATIRNVVTHEKENRMESFFLAETTKYLYLLFDESNFIHGDGSSGELIQLPYGECVVGAGSYIFNTEAHPIDMSALHCCSELKQDIYNGFDLNQFRDDILIKVEREKFMKTFDEAASDCEKNYSIPNTANDNKNVEDSSLSVDIEIFDSENRSAANVLIELYEKIKSERDEYKGKQKNEVFRNQLTINDLDEFFSAQPEHFEKAEDALKFVVNFMKNFTLDATYISGLKLIDQNISFLLGTEVQNEFEGHMRSLWELYSLLKQYEVNADLALHFDLLAVNDGSSKLLEHILLAFNFSSSAPEDLAIGKRENSDFQNILDKILLTQLDFQNAFINTTHMQEFLLKILKNGTSDKNRTFNALLNEAEISKLSPLKLDKKTIQTLFSHVRKIVEFRKRTIETFEKLQTLMKESNIQNSKASIKDRSVKRELTSEISNKENFNVKHQNQGKKTNKGETITIESNTLKNNGNDKLNRRVGESEESKDSVWSQLFQTFLRSTTLQVNEFDQKSLLTKTRKSLQMYDEYNNESAKYNLFTCQKPAFYESFAYRQFYP